VVPFSVVANAARAGDRAVRVLYQTASNSDKLATGAVSQDRENRSDNFFTFVTRTMQGDDPNAGHHA